MVRVFRAPAVTATITGAPEVAKHVIALVGTAQAGEDFLAGLRSQAPQCRGFTC